MRKKKYRLSVVLDVRAKKRDEAARFLALRRQELLEAEKELARRLNFLEKCRQEKVEASERMTTEFDDGTSAGSIVAHRDYLNILKEREQELIASVEEQKRVIRRAEEAVDEALDLLAEASKELKVIEKHKEKWKSSQKQEEEKQEQKLSDEIGAILHQRSEKL